VRMSDTNLQLPDIRFNVKSIGMHARLAFFEIARLMEVALICLDALAYRILSSPLQGKQRYPKGLGAQTRSKASYHNWPDFESWPHGHEALAL